MEQRFYVLLELFWQFKGENKNHTELICEIIFRGSLYMGNHLSKTNSLVSNSFAFEFSQSSSKKVPLLGFIGCSFLIWVDQLNC